MKLTRPTYDVAFHHYTEEPVTAGGELVELRVEIAPGDQLRGEFEAKKQGLGAMSDLPLNHTVLWIWMALVREQKYAGDFQTFWQRDLYAYDKAEGDQADADPTTSPAESAPASSWPATSVPLSSGLTPISTT